MTREEQIEKCAKSKYPYIKGLPQTMSHQEIFIEGAKWADANPTPCSVRMVGSQSYSKQQLREMGFAFDLNGNVLSPNHLAKKAAHYTVDKACAWLDNIDTDDYMVSGIFQMSDLIMDFKKAIEEQL